MKKTLLTTTIACAGALLLPGISAFAGQTTVIEKPETPSLWTFDASINMFLAGMTGNIVARGLPAPVEVGFGDVFKHLQFAAAGRFTLGYENWTLSTEFSYIQLGASPRGSDVDVEQWLVEPTLGYRFNKNIQVFAGARYNSLNTDVTLVGPLGRFRSTSGTQQWWDPIFGAQISFPISGDKLSFDGRFDVGGFGAGSDITWQAFPYLNWRINNRMSAQFGYRWLGTDYTNGTGFNRFRYDIIAHGPQVGLTMHF